MFFDGSNVMGDDGWHISCISGRYNEKRINAVCDQFGRMALVLGLSRHERDVTMTDNVVESRPCDRCKGEGTIFSAGFITLEGEVYPDMTRPCSTCNGNKMFTSPDTKGIVEIITTSRGCKDGKRKMRAAWPSKLDHYKNHDYSRAYYVWRLARFHGGKDMTMPCTADMVLGQDPFKPELDALSDQVARKVFGSDTAAARRWGKAMGMDVSHLPGLPDIFDF